ncbi:hypothetical protein DFH07DRAFT_974997 [Mycena maculata]|uniref:Uncharacterized protein n=1 Tax=Mycena maculata TaxID=230809 RepID=A0AAD7H527_9AGAR|nr:hypothetical protein DFH07DRAFT_974997 [Mycena maculata]
MDPSPTPEYTNLKRAAKTDVDDLVRKYPAFAPLQASKHISQLEDLVSSLQAKLEEATEVGKSMRIVSGEKDLSVERLTSMGSTILKLTKKLDECHIQSELAEIESQVTLAQEQLHMNFKREVESQVEKRLEDKATVRYYMTQLEKQKEFNDQNEKKRQHTFIENTLRLDLFKAEMAAELTALKGKLDLSKGQLDKSATSKRLTMATDYIRKVNGQKEEWTAEKTSLKTHIRTMQQRIEELETRLHQQGARVGGSSQIGADAPNGMNATQSHVPVPLAYIAPHGAARPDSPQPLPLNEPTTINADEKSRIKIQTDFRRFIHHTLRISKDGDATQIKDVTVAAEAYAAGSGPPPTDIDATEFSVFLGSTVATDVPKHSWNVAAGRLLVAAFLQKHPNYSCMKLDLQAQFETRLIRLKKALQKQIMEDTPTETAGSQREVAPLDVESQGRPRRVIPMKPVPYTGPRRRPGFDTVLVLRATGESSSGRVVSAAARPTTASDSHSKSSAKTNVWRAYKSTTKRTWHKERYGIVPMFGLFLDSVLKRMVPTNVVFILNPTLTRSIKSEFVYF